MPSEKSIVRFVAVSVLALAAAPLNAAAIRSLSGFNLGTFGANDDGSIQNIAITGVPGSFPAPLNFFGVNLSVLNFNNNGNFTFGVNQGMATYTPFGLTTNIGRPVIAPFFADVDTRGLGSGLAQYGWGQVDGRLAFAGNWPGVGYYSHQTDKLNTFQVFLVDRSDTGAGNFDIEFDYGQIQWETGSASNGSGGLGGYSARAGYSNGTGNADTFFEIAGSGVNGAFLDGNLVTGLIHGSYNSPVGGRYVFSVRSGQVQQPGSSPDVPQMPTQIIVPSQAGLPPVFQFIDQTPRRWFDPPLVFGYMYEMLTAGAFFTEVQFPSGSSFGALNVLDGAGNYLAGPFDCTGPCGGYVFGGTGLSSFRVTGIHPLLDAADPNFAQAFPTWLDFSVPEGLTGASFLMTPLSESSGTVIPEPSTAFLLVTGTGLLALFRRLRR